MKKLLLIAILVFVTTSVFAQMSPSMYQFMDHSPVFARINKTKPLHTIAVIMTMTAYTDPDSTYYSKYGPVMVFKKDNAKVLMSITAYDDYMCIIRKVAAIQTKRKVVVAAQDTTKLY